MPKVTRTPQCEADLAEIWMFVRQDSIRAADRLISDIYRKFESLARSPEMGRRRNELAPNLRSFVAGRYVIFYRLIENGIDVIRVLQGNRDIQSIL